MIKKITFLGLIIFASAKIYAQDYKLSFVASGAASTVAIVKVQNITQGTSLTMNGTDTLHLLASLDIDETTTSIENSLRVYPNPTTSNANIEFDAPKSGLVNIELYDITGKKNLTTQNDLQTGMQTFNVSGLTNGVYTVVIKSDNYIYTSKIISNALSLENPQISYLKSESQLHKKFYKSTKSHVQMQYTAADRLLITLTSDINYNYSTVVSIIPTASVTITSNYIATTDADNNNYPTVTIGNQIWMTENLRTTKYRNGDPINEVASGSSWATLNTGAWCSYNNSSTILTNYGRLYNFYAVADSRKLCPTGWHVPTDAEWDTLARFLYNTGINATAAKRLSSTTNWLSSTNTGAVGNTDYPTERNKTGFTAMPAGYRDNTGAYNGEGNYGQWWSATECGNIGNDAWARNIWYDVHYLYRYGTDKENGFSVRCLHD